MSKIIILLSLSVFMLFAVSCADNNEPGKSDWEYFSPEEPLTPAEASGWQLTSSSQQVVDYCIDIAEMSDGRIRYETAGYTSMGKPIPMLVLGNPAPDTPEEMEKRGLSSVHINCNIHSGEVEGKEAMLIFAREAAYGYHDELLSKIVVIIVPNMNADGNDYLGHWRSETQPLGPEPHGTRFNSQGYNLNRDFVKMEGVETRAVMRIINEWNPVLFLDAHATNGTYLSLFQTFAWGYHPNSNRELQDYNRSTFVDNVFGPQSFMQRQFGYTATTYANGFTGTTYEVEPDPLIPGNVMIKEDLFTEGRILWPTYSDLPRHTTNLAALGNRLVLLLEAYSYAPYYDRVKVQYASIYAAIESVANDIDNIKAIIKKFDDDEAGRKERSVFAPDVDISLDSRLDSYPGEESKRAVESYVFTFEDKGPGAEYELNIKDTVDMSRPRTYYVTEQHLLTPIETTKMGALYIFESGVPEVAELLMRHGIEVHRLTEDVEIDDHYRFNIQSLGEPSFYEGHYTHGTVSEGGYFSVNNITGQWEHADEAKVSLWTPAYPADLRDNRINAGSYVVSTSQHRGTLAALLLEPRCTDGLFFWNYFDRLFGTEGGDLSKSPIIKTFRYDAIPEDKIELVTANALE